MHISAKKLGLTELFYCRRLDQETTEFKEALIFAFLGLRCLLGLPNVSRDVTGSQRDSVSGSIHVPPGGRNMSLLT